MMTPSIAFAVALAVAAPIDADPSLAPWFQSLRNPLTGGQCCGTADCRNYPVHVGESHYWVQFEHRWYMVPDDAISPRTDNPTGDYVTCIMKDSWLNGMHTGPRITCFFTGPGA